MSYVKPLIRISQYFDCVHGNSEKHGPFLFGCSLLSEDLFCCRRHVWKKNMFYCKFDNQHIHPILARSFRGTKQPGTEDHSTSTYPFWVPIPSEKHDNLGAKPIRLDHESQDCIFKRCFVGSLRVAAESHKAFRGPSWGSGSCVSQMA